MTCWIRICFAKQLFIYLTTIVGMNSRWFIDWIFQLQYNLISVRIQCSNDNALVVKDLFHRDSIQYLRSRYLQQRRAQNFNGDSSTDPPIFTNEISSMGSMVDSNEDLFQLISSPNIQATSYPLFMAINYLLTCRMSWSPRNSYG